MNREIKFRGKRLDNGEWLYGDLLRNNEQVLIKPTFDEPYQYQDIDMNVDPETVGQCTGLKDKAGTDIYEGDIYRWEGYEVRDGKQIRPERIGTVKFDIYELFKLRNIIEGNGTLEIIGNKFEHIHLLTQKEG